MKREEKDMKLVKMYLFKWQNLSKNNGSFELSYMTGEDKFLG